MGAAVRSSACLMDPQSTQTPAVERRDVDSARGGGELVGARYPDLSIGQDRPIMVDEKGRTRAVENLNGGTPGERPS